MVLRLKYFLWLLPLFLLAGFVWLKMAHADLILDHDAPETTVSFNCPGKTAEPNSYCPAGSEVTITLTCDDRPVSGNVGCANTKYTIYNADGTTVFQAEQTYTYPVGENEFIVSTRLTSAHPIIKYYSTDKVGNTETEKTYIAPYPGSVFIDTDHDGFKDPYGGDTSVETNYTSGATITLKQGATTIATRTTDSSGYYSFGYVPAGSYTVYLTVPTGYGATTGNCATPRTCKASTSFDVTATTTGVTFGITPLQTVTAHVYVDENCPLNNTYEPLTDGKLAGATVDLLNSTATDIVDAGGTTDANGNYIFSDVLTGDYLIRLHAFTGYRRIVPAGIDTVAVSVSTTDTEATFLTAKEYDISGTLYGDNDDNGIINPPTDTPFTDGVQTLTTSPDGLSGTSSTSNGTYTISGAVNKTYSVYLPLPTDYRTVEPESGTIPSTGEISVSVCNADETGNNFLVRGWEIGGKVFVDYDWNGAFDTTSPPLVPDEYFARGATIRLSNGYTSRADEITDANGIYSFKNLKGGALPYTVTLVTPAGFIGTTTNPITNIYLTEGNGAVNSILDFGITPTYTISGNLFKDDDKNHLKNGSETNYSSGGQRFRATNTINNSVTIYDTINGVINFTNLRSGTYLIEYLKNVSIPIGELPSGYEMTYPTNGIDGLQPFFEVTIGKPDTTYDCSPGDHNAANCWTDPSTPIESGNGSLQVLNFGITNSITWFQCRGADCRIDTGFTDRIPDSATAACGGAYASIESSSTTPGIVFSGNYASYFRGGEASSTNWIAGSTTNDETYRPVHSNVIRTSYDYYQTTIRGSGITPTALSNTECGSNGTEHCVLINDLANGIYQSNGDLVLSNTGTYTFPANKKYVFLVNGNLYINQNIRVPVGSFVIFSATGNIIVSRTVGTGYNLNCNTTTHANCNLEGIYSADNSFVVEGIGDSSCSTIDAADDDFRLNIAGTVVVNASLGGGGFQNDRDLCEYNLSCPTYTIVERPDFILNAPPFVNINTPKSQEAAP